MLVHQVLAGKAIGGIVSLPGNAKVIEAARLLAEKRMGTVVVSENGKSAEGILSERDIVRELSRSGSGCLDKRIDQLMTRTVVTCTPDTNIQQIIEKMTAGRFRHMPVIENGELIGLISIGDVVKAQLMELAMEKDALEGMIMGH